MQDETVLKLLDEMPSLKKEDRETIKEYKIRLCSNKESAYDHLSWEDIRLLINHETGDTWGESKYRKWWYDFSDGMEYQIVENAESDNELIEIEKAKYKTTTEIMANGDYKSDKLIQLNDDQKKDPNYLMEAHGFDPSEWQLVNARNNMWNVMSTLRGVQELYSSKISVKPREFEYTFEDIKDEIQELMKNHKTTPYTHTRYSSTGKLLELNISDLHLNKLGYMKGIYDDELAEKAFFHIINDVLTRTKGEKFEKILFIWSHDFFNVDNMGKTTTAGTPQDTTMRYSDMYKKGREMLIKGIDMIKQIAPVETVQVGANHDRLTSYTMSEVLHAWYRDDENVTIDNDPLSRKYRRFGKCLIGFSHGNQERTRLGKIMPSETRKDWGKTLYAEMHAAHVHSEKAVTEDNGVIVRHLSSPSGTDNWHFSSGWVGAIPKAQSFVWDRELGLTDIIHTSIAPNDMQINQSIEIV